MTTEQRVAHMRAQRHKYDNVRDWSVDMLDAMRRDLSQPFDEEALYLAGVIERPKVKEVRK
jgi:hypothetical protein